MAIVPSFHDLQSYAWREFEHFATALLQRYYQAYGLKVVSTPPSHDGGRDAQADHMLFESSSDRLVKALATPFRLWVEVKLRSKTNVELQAIGKNLVRAINEDVSKLILVTNGDFTRGMQQEVAAFARRVRLDYCLLNGKDLVKLAKTVKMGSKGMPRAGLSGPMATKPASSPIAKDSKATSINNIYTS